MLGVTRPFTVQPGAATRVPLFYAPTGSAGNAIVAVSYPAGTKAKLMDLRFKAGDKSADFTVLSLPEDAHYSLFYDVPAGRHRLTLQSKYWRLPNATIDVSPGKLLLERGVTVVSLPSLFVSVVGDLPPKTSGRVTVLDCDQSSFEPGKAVWPNINNCLEFWKGDVVESAAIPYLQSRWYFVMAEAAGTKLGRRVDFRPGQDISETFRFARSRLFGRVLRGTEGIAAGIRIEEHDTGQLEAETESNSDGSYQLDLWAPQWIAARLLPLDRDAEDVSVFRLEVKPGDFERDFHIPATDVRILLRDAETREPLAGQVVFMQAGASAEREAGISGEAHLPPLDPGPATVTASAEKHKTEKASFVVLDHSDVQRFTVFLKPLREENSFLATLPDGRPAAGADVLVGPLGVGFRERGRCDENGLCLLADRPAPDEPVFVFHRDAALTVARAGTILEQQKLTLRTSGGILRVAPVRGQRSADLSLEIVVSVEGVQVPPSLYAIMGARLDLSHRVYLQPQFSVFELPGLPAGRLTIALVGRQTREQADDPAVLLTHQLPVDLPTTTVYRPSLP